MKIAFLERLASAGSVMSAAKSFLFAVICSAAATPALSRPENPYIIDYDAVHHPVISREGMAFSQNAIASEVGADILRRGGDAVDAAVATGLALAVTLPQGGNLGGGGFMLVYIAAEKRTIALDYYPQAPQGTTASLLLDSNGRFDSAKRYSARGVGVPGTVLGFATIHKEYGRLSWRDVVEPAIRLAAGGIIVTPQRLRPSSSRTVPLLCQGSN